MFIRFLGLFGALLATTSVAQVGGGTSAGPGSGAPGTVQSGTAGTSPSTSSPTPGTPGTPGAATGAGIPGGPGPGNTTTVPNIPGASQTGQTVGRDSGGNLGNSGTSPNPVGISSGPSSRPNGTRLTVRAAPNGPTPNFNPEAVTTHGLDRAAQDIRAMPADELRDLVSALNACTLNGHPIPRTGACAKANAQYQVRYARGRQIDRTLREFDRVVRFQNMFAQSGPRDTEYEDNINEKLRSAAKVSLAEAALVGQPTRDADAPENSRDASMPTR